VPYYVYLLSSRSRALYVGVTNDIERRLAQHRYLGGSFTSHYQLVHLVHLEEYAEINDALEREKQLKGWRRSKKVALIERENPDWRDLSDEG
jgi:putative endonuclease